jgi:hypothetical protein
MFLITFAWILAIVLSLPQLYVGLRLSKLITVSCQVWRTFNVFPELPVGWFQCTDIWSIRKHEKQLNSTADEDFPFNESTEQFYNISHLVCFQRKNLDSSKLADFGILWSALFAANYLWDNSSESHAVLDF